MSSKILKKSLLLSVLVMSQLAHADLLCYTRVSENESKNILLIEGQEGAESRKVTLATAAGQLNLIAINDAGPLGFSYDLKESENADKDGTLTITEKELISRANIPFGKQIWAKFNYKGQSHFFFNCKYVD